ncbi:MAG: MFS transporter [Prolixibacteraceae bacterium]|jgi:EmrB/QacA subfamily drug resistance transporter|nr:MFS transporter [Prolixibacteraceae bacterium]
MGNLQNNQKITPKGTWPVLLTTIFASFMNPFMLSSVNIGLPDIQEYFNCSATTLSWVSNSFLLANAMVLLPLSKASDIWGRVKFFRIGLYLFTISTLITGLSANIPMLMASRVLQGAGSALMSVTAIAIITDVFPPHKRGVALGLNIGGVYTGLSVGPFIGGLLTQMGGWRLLFFAAVPLGIITILFSHFNLKSATQKLHKHPFDYKGGILYALAIFLFIFGGGKIKTLPGILMFTTGIAFMIVFFIGQTKKEYPVLNVNLLKSNKRFTFSNLAALIHYASTFGVSFLLSLYLQYSKKLSPGEAGLVLVIQPAIMAITAPLTGRLSDKIDAGILASSGMALTFISLVMMIFISSESSITYITTSLAILGFGFGLFTSPNTNAIMGSVEKHHYGIASGINATMRVFGQTLSMMTATIFISIFLSKESISAQNIDLFVQSMNLYFITFAALCIPGIWFSIKRGN